MFFLLALLLFCESCAAFIDPRLSDQSEFGNSIDLLPLEYFENVDVLPQSKLRVSDYEHSKPPDVIISEAGYPSETHTVITEDGYILHMHRIPHPPGESHNASRKVVFLQHGLLSSSADWVVTGPDHALAFLLSNKGYDVWMGNYRGNTYSNHHTNHEIKPKDYWRFTWDEMARYDLPAMLLHMMNTTGQPSFYYIGHSMGTITYYTGCNYHPWIAPATKLMVGYGPHTMVQHMVSPIFTLLAQFSNNIEWILEHIGVYNFLPSNALVQWLAAELCDEEMAAQAICREVMFLVCGYNKNEMNNTMLPYIIGHTPAGTSTLNMIHYAQSVKTGEWKGFDYGSEEENLKYWNATKPPTYSYDQITSPVALYWGQNDWLVVPRDVQFLWERLPNVVKIARVQDNAYTHLDFLWGMHNYELLYKPTMDLMDKY